MCEYISLLLSSVTNHILVCGFYEIFTIQILMIFGYITGEVGTGFDGNGHWIQWGNSQHISMYFFFGFSGLMDILYFYEFNLPPNLDYGTSVIAFLMEGFLFANHLHGRTPLDVMVCSTLFLTMNHLINTSFMTTLNFKNDIENSYFQVHTHTNILKYEIVLGTLSPIFIFLSNN